MRVAVEEAYKVGTRCSKVNEVWLLSHLPFSFAISFPIAIACPHPPSTLLAAFASSHVVSSLNVFASQAKEANKLAETAAAAIAAAEKEARQYEKVPAPTQTPSLSHARMLLNHPPSHPPSYPIAQPPAHLLSHPVIRSFFTHSCSMPVRQKTVLVLSSFVVDS